MENIILFVKGVIIGIGKIIPGLSGSMIMMILGLYEKGIRSITHYFDDIKDNTKFLLLVGSGILVAVVLISKLIQLLLIHYAFIIICMFIGLILGGIPSVLKEIEGTSNINNIFIFIIFFILSLSLILSEQTHQINIEGNPLIMFVIGIIEAATMIIPGISGTAVLMALGLYHVLIEMFSNLSNLNIFIVNIKVIVPFGLGLLIGSWFFIKLMDYLLSNYKIKTYWAIIAFAISSIVLMFEKAFESSYTLTDVTIGFSLLIIGYFASRSFIIKFSY
ncbi:MAG: DUF368 domain-containing protein [Mollicutes bacterium]|nr:DUF368 domain-containing protein [Mollicutes bacterium]